MEPNGNGGPKWQTIAQAVVGVSLAMGAYVWSATVAEVKELSRLDREKYGQIIALQKDRDAQDRQIAELLRKLETMDAKLDRALATDPRPTPRPTTLGGNRFGLNP